MVSKGLVGLLKWYVNSIKQILDGALKPGRGDNFLQKRFVNPPADV